MEIYIITNKVNNKRYIGKNATADPNYYGSGKLICKAIEKYGIENFVKEVIETVDTIEKLNERERYWISYYNAVESYMFYNLKDGGDGGDPGPNARKTISKKIRAMYNDPDSVYNSSEYKSKLMGRIPWNKGKKLPPAWNKGIPMSDITKQKLSMAKKGSVPWNKGKIGIYSDETLKKMSESSKGQSPWNKGKIGIYSDETLKKMSESAKSRNITPDLESVRREKIRKNSKSARAIIDSRTNLRYNSKAEYGRVMSLSRYLVNQLLKKEILVYENK